MVSKIQQNLKKGLEELREPKLTPTQEQMLTSKNKYDNKLKLQEEFKESKLALAK